MQENHQGMHHCINLPVHNPSSAQTELWQEQIKFPVTKLSQKEEINKRKG